MSVPCSARYRKSLTFESTIFFDSKKSDSAGLDEYSIPLESTLLYYAGSSIEVSENIFSASGDNSPYQSNGNTGVSVHAHWLSHITNSKLDILLLFQER